MKTKVSVVIPTYNQGQYIADCLNSLIHQTYGDMEVIVQDSESTDDTELICTEYARRDPRIRYFREKDNGQSDAINRGLNRSTGKLWTWIGSDDRFNNPQALEELMKVFDENLRCGSSAVGVFGNGFYMDEEGKILGPYYQFTRDLQREDFQLHWPLAQPSSILLKQRVLDVGGVDASLHLGMDLDLFIRMLDGDRKLAYCDHPIADVRIQPASKSVSQEMDTAVTAMLIVRQHFGSLGCLSRSAYAREFRYTFDRDTDEATVLGLRMQEADLAVRLGQIAKLRTMLDESEADRRLRGEQIQTLTKLLRESEADRVDRLEQIFILTGMLESSNGLPGAVYRSFSVLRALAHRVIHSLRNRRDGKNNIIS